MKPEGRKKLKQLSEYEEENIRLRIELQTLSFKESQEHRFIWWVWNVYSKNVNDLILSIISATTYDNETMARFGKYELPKKCYEIMERVKEGTDRICDGAYLDVEISTDVPDYYKQELARRDEIIARLKEDGERLAISDGYCCPEHERYVTCISDKDEHATDCPIALHRQLMVEIEETNRKAEEANESEYHCVEDVVLDRVGYGQMKWGLVYPQPLLNQCKCGQSPAVYWHHIKGTANHINYFSKCQACKIRTRSRSHEQGAIDDWNNEKWLYDL